MEGYYKALEITKWNEKPTIHSRSFRNLEKHEILVRVMCTTICPADLMFLQGEYGDLKPDVFPVIPGMEGSGEIVKVGSETDQSLIGKRVGIFANCNKVGPFDGVWAEYHYTTLENLLIFDKNVPFERISFTINPLTAVAMYDTLKRNMSTSVVMDAADSALGKMFLKLCSKEGIETISLVKNKDHFKNLQRFGFKNIINCEDEGWEKQLEKYCLQANVRYAFDCCGGESTGKLFSALPNGTTLYHFGNLMHADLSCIKSADLLFKDKTLTGFWLARWFQSLTPQEFDYYLKFIIDDIQGGGETFLTEISKYFKIDEFDKAMSYYSSNMHEGKVILHTSFFKETSKNQ